MAILLKSRKSLNIEEQKGKALKAFSYFSRKKSIVTIWINFFPRSNSIPNTERYQKKDEKKKLEQAHKKVNNINVAIAKRKEFRNGQKKGKEKVSAQTFTRLVLTLLTISNFTFL